MRTGCVQAARQTMNPIERKKINCFWTKFDSNCVCVYYWNEKRGTKNWVTVEMGCTLIATVWASRNRIGWLTVRQKEQQQKKQWRKYLGHGILLMWVTRNENYHHHCHHHHHRIINRLDITFSCSSLELHAPLFYLSCSIENAIYLDCKVMLLKLSSVTEEMREIHQSARIRCLSNSIHRIYMLNAQTTIELFTHRERVNGRIEIFCSFFVLFFFLEQHRFLFVCLFCYWF